MAVYRIYCDESCTGGEHRSLVVAGTMVEATLADSLDASMNQWRSTANMSAELKWVKVSANKLEKYRAVMDAAFRRIDRRQIAFKSVVFQKRDIRFGEFHEGNEDVGLQKFIYNMILHGHVPQTDPGDRLVVLLDKRNQTAGSLSDLQRCINLGIRKLHGYERNICVNVESLDSKSSNLAQVNDILMGAIGFHNNDRHLVDGGARNRAKKELAAHVAGLAGVDNLCVNTPPSATHFGIWQFQFGAAKALRK